MFKIKNISDKKIEIIIFFISFFLFLILGIIITYTFNFLNNSNLIFEADNYRVINDISALSTNHYRINVHPLFLIIMQPIYYLLFSLTLNRMISIIILSSLASSITILYIYKILSIFSNKRKEKIIIILLYMFSFSNIIFTSSIEIYNFAAMFLVILYYYFIKKIKNKKINDYIFPFLGIFAFGFTITNFLIFLIVMFVLFISKKTSIFKTSCIIILSLFLSITINTFQSFIWPNTPSIFESNLKNEHNASNYNIGFNNFKNVIKNNYSCSFIATNLKVKVSRGFDYIGDNYVMDFKNLSIINIILIILFYIVFIVLLIRNFKKELFINIALSLSLLFNTFLHLVYGNEDTFLYSMHFLYLLVLLLGINLLKEKNYRIKKISIIYLNIFIVFELLINLKIFNQLFNIIKHILDYLYMYKYLNTIIYIVVIIIFSLLITLLSYFIIKYFKSIYKKYNKKDIIKLIIALLSFKLLFIGYNYFFEKIIPYEFIQHSKYEVTSYVHSKLEMKYKNEYIKYQEYKNEYNSFIDKYKPKVVNNISNNDFYFFGMGNRKKLVFLKDGLKDIDSNKYLYKFHIKDYLIIPNIYTVIIETKNGDFIKIYEDNIGVYYEINDKKELIDGTNILINLYNFDNQEYKEIKKVLYSEILFNIKDSKIYPNIIVYDNPWYRDGAMSAMVLKETNNTDLISNWVNNINNVYDYQNNGISETDNLGELLYIISTQEIRNDDLIKKIIVEAQYNSNKNNGKYLSGYTDFTIKEVYQNLWYKFGLENLDMNYSYDITGLKDEYEVLTWWSNNKIDKKTLYKYSYEFPYLSMAQYHKLKKGKFYVNKKLYPLSWEQNASQASYNNLSIINNNYINNHIALTHSWSASEMLLFLLDETNDLKYIR